MCAWRVPCRAMSAILLCVSVFLLADTVLATPQDDADRISFDRQIRPILSDLCFDCHGPDESQRTSGLRLDQQAGLFSRRDGGFVVAAGQPEASLLHQRIWSSDVHVVMPPSDFERQLSTSQKELLTRWIEEGGQWSEHWAFVPPRDRPLPETRRSDWRRNPIDDFVLARLEAAGLQPAVEADRETLIRRVSLDLTGLPPTLSEVDAFLADQQANAWERVVDRLLSSEAYGEHMAVDWLDAARYADTSGYQNDGPREMWRWRDWVIDAFNRNQPFDQFTTEQLAGDLLPDPTLQQRIATGFNRNHRGNAEGGIIPEEYQVEYVADRVDTTFAVWQGLTMGCARCHDHKYDPLSQKDYYRAFAWFNNLPESGRAIKEGNSPPFIKAPLPHQQQQWSQLQQRIDAADQLAEGTTAQLRTAVEQWRKTVDAPAEPEWSLTDGLLRHYACEGNLQDSVTEQQAEVTAGSVKWASRSVGQAVVVDDVPVETGDVAEFGYFDRFSLTAWIRPDRLSGTVISRMIPEQQGTGYYVHLQEGKVQVNLVKRWLDDSIRVQSRMSLTAGEWVHLAVVYDGSRVASGIRLYLNGKEAPLQVVHDGLNQTFAVAKQPLRIGGGQSNFHGGLDEIRVYTRDLTAAEVELLAVEKTVGEILPLEFHDRSPAERRKLERVFLERGAVAEFRHVFFQPTQLRRDLRELLDQIPTVMVMQEMSTPRQTHVLQRGQYDRPGEPVRPGVPEAFAGSFVGRHENRLDLAEWLLSQENPLTARVAVNRFWQRYFERGLVRTSEDFGSQGEPPSHPQLLDWLAREFVRSGWDIKAMQRLIVTSAVYRQSSRASAEQLERDPENRLLSRGPRRRLSAEAIRDQALFVAGLLNHTVGGPSVKPYQPEGLWKEIATDTDYVQSTGPDLYRRSLYTYWKRTVAPPMMVTFDATSREACMVNRSRTNTPLQALALMNGVTFVEAARNLAQQELLRSAASVDQRMVRMFRIVTSRKPSAVETQILVRRYAASLKEYKQQPQAAAELVAIGDTAADPNLDVAELAALTTVGCVLLNLDEVITKE